MFFNVFYIYNDVAQTPCIWIRICVFCYLVIWGSKGQFVTTLFPVSNSGAPVVWSAHAVDVGLILARGIVRLRFFCSNLWAKLFSHPCCFGCQWAPDASGGHFVYLWQTGVVYLWRTGVVYLWRTGVVYLWWTGVVYLWWTGVVYLWWTGVHPSSVSSASTCIYSSWWSLRWMLWFSAWILLCTMGCPGCLEAFFPQERPLSRTGAWVCHLQR